MLRDAFVNTLIPPTYKDDALQPRVTPCRLLREQFTCSRHQHDRGLRLKSIPSCRIPHTVTQQRFHGLEQGLRLQHHSLAPAKRPVIHGAVAILRKYPQIQHLHVDQPGLPRPPHNPMIKRPRKKFRKNSDQIKPHSTQL